MLRENFKILMDWKPLKYYPDVEERMVAYESEGYAVHEYQLKKVNAPIEETLRFPLSGSGLGEDSMHRIKWIIFGNNNTKKTLRLNKLIN
jgi:hypothetical protein